MLKNLSRGKPDGALPRTEVYIAVVDDFKNVTFDRPDFLLKELSGHSEEAAEEKLAAYALLARALELSFGLDSLSGLSKSEDGKPFFNGFSVSVSHSHGLVAAAVSLGDVGVDIEEVTPDRFNAGLAEKIYCEGEPAPRCADEFILLWTKKEALFKRKGGGCFLPWKINTAGMDFKTVSAWYNGKSFYVTVSADNASGIGFFSLSQSIKLT